MAIDAFRSRRGQAAVEFAISVFLIALVVSALVTFSGLISSSLDMLAELRAKAGEEALEGAIGQTPAYVSDWDAGADALPFTLDDTPKHGGTGVAGAMTVFANGSVSSSDDWAYPSEHTFLPFSMINFRETPSMPVSFAEAKDSEDVEIDPLATRYLFGSSEATVSEEVYMPMMGGLL